MSNKIYYKLTDQNQETLNRTKWELGEWREAANPSVNEELCSGAWLHGYLSPELAVILNPIHADFRAPRLFKAEIMGEVKFDGQLKFGAQRMRIIEEMALPVISTEQRIRFGILCALECNQTPEFVTWANNWLNNVDRTAASAKKAYNAAWAAYNAANAANAATDAAWAAYNAANAAYYAANAAANAANTAYDAAYWAAKAAKVNPSIDLISLAKKALKPYSKKNKTKKNKVTKKDVSSKKKK